MAAAVLVDFRGNTFAGFVHLGLDVKIYCWENTCCNILKFLELEEKMERGILFEREWKGD